MAQEQAAEILDFLQQLPLLTPREKRGVLGLLKKTLLADDLDFVCNSQGISIWRDVSNLNRNRIYRVSGQGEVEQDAETVFELLCNMDLIPEWDMLYKGAKYLNFVRDPSGRCEVGDIHVVYGLPGVSPTPLLSDRDFVLRTARVYLPNGMAVLYSHSLHPDLHIPGDPGKAPNMIRGHMWDSGYVVVPTANGCCLNITLQVDPKGWIPTSVVNFSLEAIPLNIQRIRTALTRISPALLQQLPELNRLQGDAAAGTLPPLETLGPGGVGLHAAAAAAAAAAARASSSRAESGNGGAAAAATGASRSPFDDEQYNNGSGAERRYGSPASRRYNSGVAGSSPPSGAWSPASFGGSSPVVHQEPPDLWGRKRGSSSSMVMWGDGEGGESGQGEEDEVNEWFDA